MTYTREQISKALNSAADDIIEAAELPDTGVRDGLDLLVNLAVDRLENPDISVRDVIAANYQADPDEVLSWMHER